jgi:hypothetical protein
VSHYEPIPGAALVVVSLGRAGADEDAGLASLVQEGEELGDGHGVERHGGFISVCGDKHTNLNGLMSTSFGDKFTL